MLLKRQLLAARLGVAHRQIVVAMLTFKRAAVGNFNGHLNRSAPPLLSLVDQAGEFTVTCCLNQLPLILFWTREPIA